MSDLTVNPSLPDAAETRRSRLHRASWGLALATGVLGAIVLLGWLFDVRVLKYVVVSGVSMKANTALGFVLASIALVSRLSRAAPPWALRLSRASAVLLLLLFCATLLQELLGWRLGIDELLFEDAPHPAGTGVPGRPSPATALCFMLTGVGLLLLDGESRRGLRPSQWLALAVSGIALLALLEYLYELRTATGKVAYSQMALHTALGFLLLCAGMLFARPGHGLMASVTSEGSGGVLARRLLPAVTVLLSLLGWLRLVGEETALYKPSFGVALLVLASIVCLSGLTWWTASSLYRAELEQARAARALRHSEERYRGIVEAAREGIWTLDRDGCITFANERLATLLGCTREALLGRALGELLDVRDEEVRQEVGLGTSTRDLGPQHELALRREDGSLLWVMASTTLFTDDGGHPSGSLTLVTDITERRRLEESRRRTARLEEQWSKAEQANRLKSEFLANMSHELRTPLNSIIGFAELLTTGKLGPLQDKQKEFLRDISSSGRHLLQLINDVLDLSKVEAGRLELRPERVELPVLMRSVVDTLQELASRKRISIGVTAEDTLGELMLDPVRLKQVLYNYLSNALKFTPDGGRVMLRARPEGPERFRLEVEDTGIGIRPEELPDLFQPFRQLDAGTGKRYQGTGLGLALTRELVSSQGGQVGVRSRPGEGSVFFASLPRVTGTSLAPPVTVGPLFIPSEEAPTLLVVEDEEKERLWLTRVLVEAGYAVEAVTSGVEAVERAAARRYDAITLDIILGDINGLEVARRIRESGLSRDVPIIVVTVVKERQLLSAVKVDEVLNKPVSASELLETLVRQGAAPGRGRKVLVVDDNPKALRQARLMLDQAGFHPLCVSSGEEALRAVMEEPPAAIILDLLMPGMDGVQFLKRLRTLPGAARLPVVVWTIKELAGEERGRLLMSAQQVVEKRPGDSTELLHTLQSLLHTSPRPGNPA